MSASTKQRSKTNITSSEEQHDKRTLQLKTNIERNSVNLTYQDFQGQVSRVHRIKENTQKIFEEKFRLLRERRDQSLETEDDGSVHSEVTESHGNRTKMIHHTYPHYQPLDQSLPNNRITEEDAFVPTKEQFAIFPVGDKPLFPARRKMGSKGWQIGLRDYSDSKKLDPLYPINGNAPSKLNSNVRGFDSLPQLTNPRNFQLTDHDEAPRAGSSDAASPALMRQRLNRSSTDNSFFVRGMEPFVDLEKPAWPDRPRSINSRLSRSQYELQELPDVSSEQARKYFGEEAIQSFFDTYKQLQSRGKVLLGGYEELQGIIHQSAEDNVLNESVRVLENSGVLTPRGDNNFSSSRNASFALNSVLEESDDVASFFNRSDNGDLFGVQAEDSSSNKMLNLRLGLSEVEDEKNGSNLDAKVISEKIPKIVASGKLGQNIKAPSTPYSMLATASFPLLDTSLCSNSNGAGGSFSDNFVELYNSEDGIVSNYNVSSPRAVFLNGCLLHNIPPITISLIRKRISSTIDLAHMGIGNTVAQILASCLKDIPFLQMVDLTDNNLEDDGLTALINSIAAHPSIEKIDLSQNIIDGGAADALANFIGTPECRLTSLHMSDANIDDGECAHFVEVLMRNRHLKELDMSKNLIGKDENLNVVKADFVTGGESLAELISDGKCPLETLNLHWNMIRLKGAVALCDSLRQNRTLMHLDLSYNALGQAGALTLGNALTENKSLRNLNLANNSIDAIGCFTLCVGARENTSLEFMNLDGNPLGEQGGRILMKLAASDGHRLSISAVKCDFLIRSETKLKINEPCGYYDLDLSLPYDRAIALELLDIAALDPAVDISFCEYLDPNNPRAVTKRPQSGKNSRPPSGMPASNRPGSYGNGNAGVLGTSSTGPNLVLSMKPKPAAGYEQLEVERYESRVTGNTLHEEEEANILMEFEKILKLSATELLAIVKKYDLYSTDTINSTAMNDLFKEIGMRLPSERITEIILALDPQESRYIEIPTFMEFITSRATIAKDRLHDLRHEVFCSICVLGETIIGPPRRYIPPKAGRLHFFVVEGFLMIGDISCRPISAAKAKQVIKAAEATSNPLALLLYGVEAHRLYMEESKLFYDAILLRTEDSVQSLGHILQRMYLSRDAMTLVRSYIGPDVLRLRRLKQRLGLAFYPLLGIFSGFYALDLSNKEDRMCMTKLIEQNIRNEYHRRLAGKWDISQNGNWSCFRNEYHITYPDMTISPKYFVPIPQNGKLEFDFVNIARPNPRTNKPLSDDRVIDVLLVARLLRDDNVELAYKKLKDYSIAGRKAFLSNGNPYYRADLGRALNRGEYLHQMYQNITNRKKSLQRVAKKEALKAVAIAKSTKEASGTENGKTLSGSASKNKPKVQSKFLELVQDAVASGSSKEYAVKFRSLVNREIPLTSLSGWKKRLFEVMIQGKGSDENKSAALLEFFEAELCSSWLYCKQVAFMLEVFTIGVVDRSQMGSYRVELLVRLFDRIVDLYNFEMIMMNLNAEEQAAVYFRIGYLNVFNTCKPEGGYHLDLQRWEERQIAKILIHLSVVEPGENWLNKGFMFDHGFTPIPGWDLTVVWFTEEGLPKKGVLTFEMFAGDGLNLLGCSVDKTLRNILTSLVLVDQRELDYEIQDGTLLRDERRLVLTAYNSSHQHRHLHHDHVKYPLSAGSTRTEGGLGRKTIKTPSAKGAQQSRPIDGTVEFEKNVKEIKNRPSQRYKQHRDHEVHKLPDYQHKPVEKDESNERPNSTVSIGSSFLLGKFVSDSHEVRPELALLRLKTQVEVFKLLYKGVTLSSLYLQEEGENSNSPVISRPGSELGKGTRPQSAKPRKEFVGNSTKSSRPSSANSAKITPRPAKLIKIETPPNCEVCTKVTPPSMYTIDDANQHLLDNTDLQWDYCYTNYGSSAVASGVLTRATDTTTWVPTTMPETKQY